MARSPLFPLILAGLLLASAAASCCVNKQIPGLAEPIAGSWNGYIAEAADGTPTVPAGSQEAEDIAAMRLNIYDDNTFDLASNYTIRSGTIASTGKGNYIVQSALNTTVRNYLRYDEAKDTLTWESQGTRIEFRRNDRPLTKQELVEYNDLLLAEVTTLPVATTMPVITPVPTYEIASLQSEGFGYDPTTQRSYEFNGDLRINAGVFKSVVVILRYPDHDEYHLDLGGMGGANFTKKDVQIILDDRVRTKVPLFFIRLDQAEYPANVTVNVTRDIYGNVTANFTDIRHFSAFAPVG